MVKFVDKIIEYLNNKFKAETSLSKKPFGNYDTDNDIKPTTTDARFVIKIFDSNSASETFLADISSNIMLQISVYGIYAKYNGKFVSAQKYSMILGDLILKYMEEYKYSEKGIIQMRRTSYIPSLPYNDGDKLYYSVVRYNILIENKEI